MRLVLRIRPASFAKASTQQGRVKAVTTAGMTGRNVSAYRNLHNGLWSLKDRSTQTVAGHTGHVVVHAARFAVGEKARQRVIQEKQKNVHAFVRGTVEHVEPHEPPPHAVAVSYNPYKAGHFYRKDTGEAVHSADTVHMTPKGVFAVNPRGA
ncbi:hypothetical protein [Deinococcus sp. UR1]|uniref:hypothetical protein n=1 Tax=Deinococcus sp. UR1 TaxID=1704277 RepID=UPI000C19386C|nr:hypothetical protein [Deinococcus sp. UR1]PIG96915.1 hypothetical protein AMD26_015430 [Deinococcus sp. UR1]